MRSGLRTLALTVGLAILVVAAPARSRVSATAAPANDDKTILHVLNRIAFGPRPGDVDKVRSTGIQAYIDQQLHPERIPDGALEARLAGLTTLKMSSREIAQDFAEPLVKARQQAKQAAGDQGDAAKPPAGLQQQANRVMVELSEQKVLRAEYSDRQLEEVLTDFWFNHFNVDARKGQDRFMLTEYERDAIRPHVLGKFRDLLGATAKSPAMLFYLDNWMSADPNGPHPVQQPQRPQPLNPPVFGGRGRGPFGRPGPIRQAPLPRAANPQNKNAPKGLNENYGREVMELHTLGVDGGYTQKDVTEVARAFTGWTIQNPRQGGGFIFQARLHDPGQKIVLGHIIRAGGGQNDGEQVLDILASHPSTARFISTELARRFVGDTPPPARVDRLAARFTATGGDLREVMRTLLSSPEFLSPDAYRAKVKTPFDFVVSAVRATGADVQDAAPLVRALQQLGMPLYQCQPPTGYKDTADAWVNTGALVARMNFALQLASNKLPGNVLPAPSDGLVQAVLNDDVSEATRGTIAKAKTPEQMIALTLGSPEFQRR
jgi:uncharacterized protein (DUF1800 family)